MADEAAVFGNATVEDDAIVSGQALAYYDSYITDRAEVSESVEVVGSTISKNGRMHGEAKVYYAHISTCTEVLGDAVIYGDVFRYESD